MPRSPYRALPSVDRVCAELRARSVDAADSVLLDLTREALAEARARIGAGGEAPTLDAIAGDVTARVDAVRLPPLRPLINATGVILHTNLGRAPLAGEAIAAMAAVSRGYSNLEFDITSGRRGTRHSTLAPLLRRVTGAEAAMAVNNNASAVLLALAALAAGREVVLSRGELVEIGGGFRIPDVMRQSRARLVEAGTTNRTRIEDFEAAIGPRTAALMRVHASNFRITGFTESAPLDGLATLARRRGVLLIDDIGSGCLLDTAAYGLAPEPTPQRSVAAGADVVLFSGDKLLGGPQAGLIVGRNELIARMQRHPLARAVRLDKASIAGLAATLRLYIDGVAEQRVPVWRMIAMPVAEIERRAGAVVAALGAAAQVVDGRSMVGGGSLPEESLPTRLVVLAPVRSAATLAGRLRASDVVARIEDGRVLLDLRTVDPLDDGRVIDACAALVRPQ
ncbi:MAG: L-seryl-tRNA(Sec) selenium transferase [Dehalococcoidia bacterium]|nr:L-seryl-tRNA(Sec) selenium transferase [Dehalococcoidia bacterium]